MKKKRYTQCVCTFLMLMLTTGCSLRDVLDDYPVTGIWIKLDWSEVSAEVPEGMRVIFYPIDGQGRKVEDYLPSQGGEVKVPPGWYSVVMFNRDTETVVIRGEESYETIEAYTGTCNGLNMRGEDGMVWGPDPLHVVKIDELRVGRTEEQLVVELKPQTVVKSYSFELKASGLHNISDIHGTVTGMADSYLIGKSSGSAKAPSIYFEGTKGDGVIKGLFTAFGLPGTTTRVDFAQMMTLELVKVDGSIQKVEIDITEAVKEPDPGTDPGPNPPGSSGGNIDLGIEDEIEIEDVPPMNGGDGGMGGDVGDWDDEDEVELPLN